MFLPFLAFIAGMLTLLSPCILPVLPFLFAGNHSNASRHTFAMLIGMMLTFAVIASLAAVAGEWVIEANDYGRHLALIFFALFGAMLLFPALATRLTAPLVALGNHLSACANRHPPGWAGHMLLGVATGLLWTPCAGPILGLILTTAATKGISLTTSLLLVAYAAGAACALLLVLRTGDRLMRAVKRRMGASEWLKRLLGALMLLGVAAIASGADVELLASITASLNQDIEHSLLQLFSSSGAH
ncbi:cytochrome c biogenesis protein CcdA [Pantoea sp.]|uniref:cytochrome c biogenesis CcdA family protein n=1 Tax=Pantoea sp. TaxID=69393 RepID=UPI0031DD9F79